ncbi:hypothetical protein [Saccharothrix stipae]
MLGVGAGIGLTAPSAAGAAEVNPLSVDNVGGATILNPGGTASWWFDRGGADFHVQLAGPNILPPLNGAKHTFFNFGKAIFSSGYVQYYVVIRNDGTAAATHNLEAGGVT